MMVSTHVTAALAVTIASLTALAYYDIYGIPVSQIAPFIFAVMIGSVFPDIDEPESWIGRRTKIISNMIKMVFGHRGMTHTLVCSVFVFVALTAWVHYLDWKQDFYYIFFGFSTGWVLHSFGDAHTKSGVKFLMPFSNKTFWVLPKGLRFVTSTWRESVFLLIYNSILIYSIYFAITNKLIDISQLTY